MTKTDLAKSYVWKAETRIDALEALNKRGNFSDVVREAQEQAFSSKNCIEERTGVEKVWRCNRFV